jgi:hypothetical protein
MLDGRAERSAALPRRSDDDQLTQRLLHNQRALYIKRLLLFEPRVILTSVPYRVG